MRCHRDIKNTSGFSILELLMVVGIGSIVALSLTQLSVNFLTSLKSSEDLVDIASIVNVNSRVLEQTGVCFFNIANNASANSFQTNNPADEITINRIQIPPIGSSAVQTILTSSAAIPNSDRLAVGVIKLKDFQPTSANTFRAVLSIPFNRTSPLRSGPQTLVREIGISLATNIVGTTATITNCNSMSLSIADMAAIESNNCSALGGVYNAAAIPRCAVPVGGQSCPAWFDGGVWWGPFAHGEIFRGQTNCSGPRTLEQCWNGVVRMLMDNCAPSGGAD